MAKGRNNTTTKDGHAKRRHLLSKRNNLKGYDHPIMGFLSVNKLRCLEIMGCKLDVAFHGAI